MEMDEILYADLYEMKRKSEVILEFIHRVIPNDSYYAIMAYKRDSANRRAP